MALQANAAFAFIDSSTLTATAFSACTLCCRLCALLNITLDLI
jgi:hypothetical protein